MLNSEEKFDERRPGLDHIAFGVGSRQELVAWAGRLDELGVARGKKLHDKRDTLRERAVARDMERGFKEQ